MIMGYADFGFPGGNVSAVRNVGRLGAQAACARRAQRPGPVLGESFLLVLLVLLVLFLLLVLVVLLLMLVLLSLLSLLSLSFMSLSSLSSFSFFYSYSCSESSELSRALPINSLLIAPHTLTSEALEHTTRPPPSENTRGLNTCRAVVAAQGKAGKLEAAYRAGELEKLESLLAEGGCDLRAGESHWPYSCNPYGEPLLQLYAKTAPLPCGESLAYSCNPYGEPLLQLYAKTGLIISLVPLVG